MSADSVVADLFDEAIKRIEIPEIVRYSLTWLRITLETHCQVWLSLFTRDHSYAYPRVGDPCFCVPPCKHCRSFKHPSNKCHSRSHL
jgi:hypothetical protein